MKCVHESTYKSLENNKIYVFKKISWAPNTGILLRP